MSKLSSNEKYLKSKFLGLIPEDWEIKKLKEIATIQRGRFKHRPRNDPKFYGGNIPFIQTGDVSNSGGWIRTYTQTLNEEGLKTSKMFPKGTICITIAANIGDVGILQFDSAFPDSIIGITPDKKKINDLFLLYFLMRQKDILDRFSIKSTQKNINLGYLYPLPIAIPPMLEQTKIVSILKNIDSLIQTTGILIDNLNKFKKGLMQRLFTEGIGHTEFKETRVGNIPKEWEIKRLETVLKIIRNGITSKQNMNGLGYPVTRIETISDGIINPNNVGYVSELNNDDLEKYRCKNGDILISHINSLKHIGKTAIYENIPLELYHGMNLLLLRCDEELIIPYFLFYLLNYFKSRNIFWNLANQAVNQASINQSSLGKIKIYLPNITEQKIITEILINIDNKIKTEILFNEQYKKIKKGLMQDLLTGKKRVKIN